MGRRGGAGRAVAWGAALALLLTAATVAAVFLFDLPVGGRDTLPESVVLALACAGEDGIMLTPVVVLVDTVTGDRTAFDPLAQVTIPGTTYDNLRDAYAFGGGAAVAAAVGRLQGGISPGYVVLDADVWAAAIDAAGGLRVDSPSSVDVFTGERLFSFRRGAQVLSGAETCEYLKGAAYLTDSERERVASQFAGALADAVVAADTVVPGVTTDLSADAFAQLRRGL